MLTEIEDRGKDILPIVGLTESKPQVVEMSKSAITLEVS